MEPNPPARSVPAHQTDPASSPEPARPDSALIVATVIVALAFLGVAAVVVYLLRGSGYAPAAAITAIGAALTAVILAALWGKTTSRRP